MSSTIEQLHEHIYANLSLLRENSHKIEFEQGMFRERNLPGFEKVGHALLMVIDPAECKKTIPWPLVNDKALRSEFRTKFVKFVKMINSKHPDAGIPEITASNLQFPGGLNFLRFMYKLSTFALELELKRMLSPEERKELLPKFQPSKQLKDQEVMIKIVKGARYDVEEIARQYTDYQTTASELLEKLNNHNTQLCSLVESKIKELETAVTSLNIDEHTKLQLKNIDDDDVMTEWNNNTDAKVKEIENQSHKLNRYKNLSAQSCQQLQKLANDQTEKLCLNGDELAITTPVSELTGNAMYNSQGEVRLMSVLEAGLAATRALAPVAPTKTSLLPQAQGLLTKAQSIHSRATQVTANLDSFCDENRKVISELRPIVYERMRQKKAPDYFKYLKQRPAINFLNSTCVSKTISPFKKGRATQLEDFLKTRTQDKRGCKVFCSVKKRRSTSLYSLLTPSMKAFRQPHPTTTIAKAKHTPLLHSIHPASCIRKPNRMQQGISKTSVLCKKSLYGKLPTGPRQQREEEMSPTTDFSYESFTGVSSSAHNSPLDERNNRPHTSKQPDVSEEVNNDPPKTPPCKPKRKSLCEILERYKALKKSMAENAQKPL